MKRAFEIFYKNTDKQKVNFLQPIKNDFFGLKYLLFLLCFFTLNVNSHAENIESNAKKYTLKGYVKDLSNGEELIGATIFIREQLTGVVTNNYGFYSISLPEGTYTVEISYLSFGTITRKVVLNKDVSINLELSSSLETLQEVEVTARRADANVRSIDMGVEKMEMKNIKNIPALLGEVDVLKAIQLLPGVQTTSEGSSGYSVRGGSPDQNLILMDEAPVYNASHLLGFFSIFNNDAVRDLTLYKGDIPAQYGGRLSSLLDIRMKNGNNKKFQATGGIGTISSRLTLEGPVLNENTSFILSGRRTYFDVLFLPFASEKSIRESKLYFYDVNAKINHVINENNRIFVTGYMGQDYFGNTGATMGFGNRTMTTRWNHVFSQKLFSNLTAIYSNYEYLLGTEEGKPFSLEWISDLKDIGLKYDFNYYLNTNNTLNFGVVSTYHIFEPGSAKGIGEQSIIKDVELPKHYALESGVYVSNTQQITSALSVRYGLHYAMFNNIGKDTIYNYNNQYQRVDSTGYSKGEIFNTYKNLQPRIAVTYVLNKLSSVKASYSRTVQYVHLNQNSTAGTPLDVWMPSSPNVKPQIGDQYSVGYFRNFRRNTIESSVELYYKNMQNAIDFKDFANLLLNKEMEGELRFGKAQAYGAEFMVKFDDRKINGWVSYTLSRVEKQIEGINDNKPYLANYDKPHVISVVFNYNISRRITFSSSFVYSTGNAITFPVGKAKLNDEYLWIYSDRNTYRMPDNHRMDASIILRNKFKEGRKWNSEWVFSVYNLYNRHNTWTINFVEDENNPNKVRAEKTYLFPMIPSITYNFIF